MNDGNPVTNSWDDKDIRWIPEQIIKIGKETKLGLKVDDGCYLVLVRDPEHGWQPIRWIPREAIIHILKAKLIADFKSFAKRMGIDFRMGRGG